MFEYRPRQRRPLPIGDRAREIAEAVCQFIQDYPAPRVPRPTLHWWLADNYPEEFMQTDEQHTADWVRAQYYRAIFVVNAGYFMYWRRVQGITFRNIYDYYGLRKGWQEALAKAAWGQPPPPKF